MNESKPKFTPGPWKVTEDGLVDKIEVGGDYDLIIDIVHKDGKRNDADSNLIAAAPEMYSIVAKLEEMAFSGCALVEDVQNLIQHAMLVARKARGEK